MARMPHRVDKNQPEIVSTFRKLGCSVLILSDLGKGCPDIMVGLRGRNYFFEIKDGRKPPSGQKLTEPEEKFFENWLGQVAIIRSIDEVVSFVNSIS